MIGLKSLLEYFHINTMSAAPLAISSFSTFFMLSSSTVLPVKSLIDIILGGFFCCYFVCTLTQFNCTVIVVSASKGVWSHLVLISNFLSGRHVLDSCLVLIFCLVLMFNCLSGGYFLCTCLVLFI